jgi:two-component system chemotaxis response regulator CheB
MSKKVKVLVVDDSAFSRQTIKNMLETDPDIEVIGLASDGIDAIAKTLRLKPDLITLDLDMPEMDGFSFLRWLMMQQPTPVIMVSSYSDAKTVFKALELGAVDFIAKPSKRASAELKNIEKDLLLKVKGIKDLNMNVLSKNLQLLEEQIKEPAEIPPERGDVEVVAIGASTGGPPALQIILTKLPADFPSGVIVSQHMPKGFTRSLAERLNKLTSVRVKEAEDGDEIEKGKVLICPGGHHMILKPRGQKTYVTLKKSAYEDRYIPSIDTMMASASERFGRRTMGIVLTGMGNDGKQGMLEIKARGGYTIAESEETSVVFGMPAEVINADAADKVLPLHDIPREMIRVIMGERRKGG